MRYTFWLLHHMRSYINHLAIVIGKRELSHVRRLRHFSSSVNSFFKRARPMGLDVWFLGWTLRLLPYFMCANSEGSGEAAHMHRLAWAFTGRLCDKYHNLMGWPICPQKDAMYSFNATLKIIRTWTPEKIAVIILKFKQCGFTKE